VGAGNVSYMPKTIGDPLLRSLSWARPCRLCLPA